jgi:hypothetical protein
MLKNSKVTRIIQTKISRRRVRSKTDFCKSLLNPQSLKKKEIQLPKFKKLRISKWKFQKNLKSKAWFLNSSLQKTVHKRVWRKLNQSCNRKVKNKISFSMLLKSLTNFYLMDQTNKSLSRSQLIREWESSKKQKELESRMSLIEWELMNNQCYRLTSKKD